MSRPRRPGPSPDGRHDDLPPEQWQALSLDVPDDPRELDNDRELWLREEGQGGASAGSPLFPRSTHPRVGPALARLRARRRGQRLVVTAFVLLISMVVVTVSGLLASMAIIPAGDGPVAAPLADDIGPIGDVGGLLPAVSLQEDNPLADAATTVAAQSLRPAVIALVPPDCPNCADLLREVRAQSSQYKLPLTLVGLSSQTEQLASLQTDLGAFRLDALTDPTGVFVSTFDQAAGPTLVLVREDGVIVDVVEGVSESDRLESSLVQLVPSLGSTN